MSDRQYFHESVVHDIVDVLTSLKDFDEVEFMNNQKANRSFKSITAATKDLILTFPVLASTDLAPENVMSFAKAHEKKMASLLQILFTAVSVSNNEDVYDYVKKYHANLGSMSGTLDDYADAFDKMANTFGESYEATLNIDRDVLNAVLEDLKESNYTLPDNVKESSLESYKIVPGYRTGMRDMVVKEVTFDPNNKYNRRGHSIFVDFDQNDLTADPQDVYDQIDQIVDANGGDQADKDRLYQAHDNWVDFWSDLGARNGYSDANDAYNAWLNGSFTVNGMQGNGSVNMQSGRGSMLSRPNITFGRNNNNTSNPAPVRDMSAVDKAKVMADTSKFYNQQILNNEYKKANELQPTMMIVNFMTKSDEGRSNMHTAIIGIKAKIYPVTSTDICARVAGKLDDKNVLTNFVRATTNEIAFFRDFLFAIDNAKTDALSYSNRKGTSNKLWKVLERRSLKSKFRRSLKMYNDATAITSLVISENDAEYLKKIYSVDITNVSRARKILDSYNFMCLAILNQSTEVASILYDTGDDTFEMLPFSGMEREASDNSYKKMVNLLAKVSR